MVKCPGLAGVRANNRWPSPLALQTEKMRIAAGRFIHVVMRNATSNYGYLRSGEQKQIFGIIGQGHVRKLQINMQHANHHTWPGVMV